MPNSFEFLIYNTTEGDVSVNAVVRREPRLFPTGLHPRAA